jgi:DNA-binding NarL/FixJ family response regulator
MEPLKILVADDHALMREGIRTLLDQDKFQVIAEAEDGMEAVQKYQSSHPDIVLMDLNMPRKNGLEAARDILREDKNAKVVMLTVELSEVDLMQAVDYSVKGYLLKTSSADSLNQALSLVADGESVFPSEALIKGMNRRAQGVEMGLTPREEEILRYIAKGMSNKGIARELDVTEGTIKVHIKAILKKLGIQNRTQAAIYAYEKGIV